MLSRFGKCFGFNAWLEVGCRVLRSGRLQPPNVPESSNYSFGTGIALSLTSNASQE